MKTKMKVRVSPKKLITYKIKNIIDCEIDNKNELHFLSNNF
jgi:hypothetical protein